MIHAHIKPRTIALMDSHPLTLSGLSYLVNSIDETCDIRMEETSLGRIAEGLMYQSVDILITDLHGYQESIQEGQEILQRLSLQFPQLIIVVYTLCHDADKLKRLLKFSNISLIARGESPVITDDLFRHALAKKKVLSPLICCTLAEQDAASQRTGFRLTQSENEIIKYLLNGMSLSQIAEMKNLSIKTVSAHKCNVMRKLHITTDAELFLLLKNGL
ncbi:MULTISPECIES: response regulator transcription factor [Rahnella]|jgi:two-component system capsular synthesis response regulator RcsB|uniref:response regulator transcription factor n=1 Tax=Rahnella TaxID=34037 RepID=UPI002169E3F6|nr:response regulator transcription factor [Rahnella sp. BIGb0603]MCS3421571.1 two-component system capsular synthesis response regulator RcsB [Rahnella sp. BIGb0603]